MVLERAFELDGQIGLKCPMSLGEALRPGKHAKVQPLRVMCKAQLLARHERRGTPQTAPRQIEPLRLQIETLVDRLTQASAQQFDGAKPLIARRGDEFGCGGGRRRAQVGTEILRW